MRHDDLSRLIRASKRADLLTQARWWLLALGVVGLLVWLWPRPGADLPEGVTEITLWVPNGARDRLRDALDVFESRHPEYRVVAGNSQLRDASSDPQRFLCGVAGGVPPDLIYFDRFAVVGWAARNMFHPLDAFIAEDQKAYQRLMREREMAEAADDTAFVEQIDEALGSLIVPQLFYEAAWKEARYQRDTDSEPHQWAIPTSIDARAMYLVDNMFRRAGLVYRADDPEVVSGRAEAGTIRPPQSWEEICTLKLNGHRARLVDRSRLTCPSVDFIRAGIVPGDHIALDYDGVPSLARVVEVASPETLIVSSLFDRPRASNDEILNFKIYEADSYALRLTEWDDQGRIRVLGFSPLAMGYGNAFLHIYAWGAGGRFFSDEVQHDSQEPAEAGPQRCTLDHQRIVDALEWVVDVYDALGGYEAVAAFESSYQRGPQDPLINDRLAMSIDLDGKGNDVIARYRQDMDFTVVPVPLPESEYARGRRPITWSGGWSYAIPSTAKHQEGAWQLLKWLMSEECLGMMSWIENDIQRSQGRLFIPRLSVRPRVNQRNLETYVRGNPHVPARIKAGMEVFVDLLDVTYYQPVSPAGQELWDEAERAVEKAVHHGSGHLSPIEALAQGTDRVNAALERLRAPPPGPVVPWRSLIVVYLVVIAAVAGVIVWLHRRQCHRLGIRNRQWHAGLICASPWIIGFLVFTGGPMLFSIVMSFTRYDVVNPAHWIGLGNYREMVADPMTAISLWNTIVMAISVPLGLALGLAVAMLLDTGVRGLAGYRTLYYLPAIVPMVAASILWVWVFNVQDGLINGLIARLGLEPLVAAVLTPFGVDVPVKWLQSAETSKASLILMSLWSAGAGMLIWLAGLKSIPAHLYEAAQIDGAGPLRRFVNITLPMLSPYIFFNLVMGTIAVFQIFTQAYIMTRGGPNDSTMFYAYNLFEQAFRFLRMGYAAALAWLLFAIIMVLTLINLAASKKWVHYESP